MTFLRLGAIVSAALLLVGCSSTSDGPAADAPDPTVTATTVAPAADAPTMGLPKGVDHNGAATAGAGISPDGKLWIVTYGSSTNPLAVTDVSAKGQTVTVGLAMADRPATMDLVPSTSTVALPAGVDAEQPMSVVLGKLGTVEIFGPEQVAWLPAQ